MMKHAGPFKYLPFMAYLSALGLSIIAGWTEPGIERTIAWGRSTALEGLEIDATECESVTDPRCARITSLGLPPKTDFLISASGGARFNSPSVQSSARVTGTISRPIVMAHMDAVAIEGELGVGTTGRRLDGDLGVNLRVLYGRAGLEYNLLDRKVYLKLGGQLALRRGGLLRRGDRIRIDYIPATQTVRAGVSLGIGRDYRRNRPLVAHTTLPAAPRPRSLRRLPGIDEAALEEIAHRMEWIDRLTTPALTSDEAHPERDQVRLRDKLEAIRQHVNQDTHDFPSEIERYHQALERAFTKAAGDEEQIGLRLADLARQSIYAGVLVPFNRLLGQIKYPFDLSGLQKLSRDRFHQGLSADFADLPQLARDLATQTFDRVIEPVQRIAEANYDRWASLNRVKDSRSVWLPMHWAIRQGQAENQTALQQMIGDLTGRAYSEANQVSYLLNEQFTVELKRMIRETQHYHALVIHDYRALNGASRSDQIGWDVAVHGYARAMTQAVREIGAGSRKHLPVFLLFFDQHYFEANRARPIVEFLANLYDPNVVGDERSLERLMGDSGITERAIAESVLAARVELRRAVESSDVLSALSMKERRNLLRVHVNITHQRDLTFGAHGVPDSLMRDHRKLAFRDVFEDRPWVGEAVFTGKGVGEHYSTPEWEDRSMQVRGQGLVQLKDAIRELFMSQGFKAEEVPYFLQPRELPADYDAKVAVMKQQGWSTPVSITMNVTGYGPKESSVLKAAMYDLLPRGATLVAPDSIWTNDLWLGMFLGAALKGGRVHAIAPAYRNAPSSGAVTMALTQYLMAKMVVVSKGLESEFSKVGGTLRVGFYNQSFAITDMRRRLEQFLAQMEDTGFLDGEFALHPSVVEGLKRLSTTLPSTERATETVDHTDQVGHTPKIHLKAHLMLSRSALKILRQPEWAAVIKRYFEIRVAQMTGRSGPSDRITPALLRERQGILSRSLLDTFESGLTADERAKLVYLLSLGSHNQDRRSMSLDGETLVAVGGPDALIALVDFVFLAGTAHWPETLDDVDAVFPRQSGIWSWVSRVIRDLI